MSIAFRSISKHYGTFKALDRIELEIEAGEFLTLLGPSGSGKTTLLMLLAGFARPSSGVIEVAGSDITRMPPHRRDFGVVFQNYALFPHMSVTENVGYPLRMRRCPREEIDRRVADALELVQLGHLAERRIDQLSGGQRQRIALARAVVFSPRVLLMDEPLSALDKKLREQMQIEIRHLHERLGITTIYVTHDQREALTMSDRVAVIDGGRLIQLEEPASLYAHPATRFVADFIGESTLLPVARQAGRFAYGEQPVSIANPVPPGAGEHWLVVRPERLVLLDGAAPDGINRFTGTVEDVVFQGETLLARVRLATGDMLSLRRDTRREVMAGLPRTGEPISLGLAAEETVIVPERAP
ncbi:ABC transporter ATP-binding protein [Marinimicrococcus flavescens]|uniref:Spermidine/putrescine import ATP-binding protein PotA n=1 Tax=Marinimicrococcus flavescens TaxID=3031815 RepID=A0AAP3XSU0_9PROT|nr:ABC transporter ATP-binding protein [Marinimicrococcus flavescens]